MKLATKFIVCLVLGFTVLLAVDTYLAVRRESLAEDRIVNDGASALLHGIDNIWQKEGQLHARGVIQDIGIDGVWKIQYWSLSDISQSGSIEYSHQLSENVRPSGAQEGRAFYTDSNGNRRLITYMEMKIETAAEPQVLVVEHPVSQYQAFREFAVRLSVKTAITFLLGGLFVMVMGHELVSKPLKQLVSKTRRIGQGDLSSPLKMNRWDEFGELAGAVNAMCDQLSEVQGRAEQETAARVAATDQLRHAERLHTVGRLASGIAHELGTPLNVVSGRAGLIASGKLSPEDTKESAEIIKSEADRITTIIRQLLDFARRNTPHKASTDLRQIVSQLLNMLDPLADKGNYELSVQEQESPVLATVDSGQIQQVLTNLLINAAQAMPDGGKIEIGFRKVHTEPPSDISTAVGEFVCIDVRDQGEGIDEEHLQHIFEPFFTTKEVGKGTGLGLSIAYGIVHEHGGWISVESSKGEGTRFSVFLPAEEKA